jgi:fluoride exporter
MTRFLLDARPAGAAVNRRVRHRPTARSAPWDVLLATSAGGAIGALTRYGAGHRFPAAPGSFPWTTFTINVTGCLLIGVLMVLITQVRRVYPLIRPFLGVGVLGGFTTFSTYVVDIQRLVGLRAAGTALGYLAATVVTALAATWVGVAGTRWMLTLPGRISRRSS